MSFVDGRVIRQRMAKKDARMAKIAAKRLAKSAKIVGAGECLNTQTAPDRNGQTLTEGAHRVTAIPHSNPTPPVRTDNRVSTDRFVKCSYRCETCKRNGVREWRGSMPRVFVRPDETFTEAAFRQSLVTRQSCNVQCNFTLTAIGEAVRS